MDGELAFSHQPSAVSRQVRRSVSASGEELMRDFRELKVWQKAHALTLDVYRATKSFPRDELYSLTNQIRRAAVSIGANIAEGAGKNTRAELARFLQIALGSASELEYHLLLSRDLGYLVPEVCEQLSQQVIETKKMLSGFVQYLGLRKTGTEG
jgi:four helix bundle protein